MPLKNPLEIPEIASLVASYLQGKDLARCVQVSKNWRDLFLPHRWRVIRRGSRVNNPYMVDVFGPVYETMYHHRHLIKNLSMIAVSYGLPYCFPNLRKLTIDLYEAVGQRESVSLDLIKMTPLLVTVEFISVKPAQASWIAVSAHPHIKNLEILYMGIRSIDAPVFWKACEKMEVLEMRFIHIGGEGIPTDVAFNHLRKLVLCDVQGLDGAGQLDLILRSPKLESLDWRGKGSEHVELPTLIRHPIQEKHWPHLNKLLILNSLNDSDVASILKAVESLVHLNALGRCRLGIQAFRALEFHFSTLVKLNLASCYSVASSTIRDVMCCCRRLEELHARSLFAKDIEEGGPWGCQQLRVLRICFRVGESEQDLQRLVFERLSTLVRLEYLIMHIPNRDQSDEGVLEFRLECGLDQLASLQQLTRVVFYGNKFVDHDYIPQMGLEEAAWMRDHWKKLKHVIGTLNKDPQVNADIHSALKARSPSIKDLQVDADIHSTLKARPSSIKMADEGSTWTFFDWRRLFSSFMQ